MHTTLSESIRNSTDIMFHNLRVAMKTCDWQADICGAPAWRYIYHTIHSCDKYFINPTVYDEPAFHIVGIDWPDHLSDAVFTKEQLEDYFTRVREKILAYLNALTDKELNEIPNGCAMTRMGLILSQYRHMYAHIGIINGVTIAKTGKYPRILNESSWTTGKKLDELYDDDVRS